MRLSVAQTRALKLVEVCACEVYPPDFETGMVVCWVCEVPVVRVEDDGIGPGLVHHWIRSAVVPHLAAVGRRVLKEEEERAATVVRNQEEETA